MTESLITRRHLSDTLPKYWYVVFTDNSNDPLNTGIVASFIKLFTSPGYRHCFVFTPSELGTLVLDPSWTGLAVSWSPAPPERIAQACLLHGHKVLLLEQNHIQRYYSRGFITCVSIIKMTIGLKSWKIITPKQLFKAMLAAGAHIIPLSKSR
jgi:hypothetical protein